MQVSSVDSISLEEGSNCASRRAHLPQLSPLVPLIIPGETDPAEVIHILTPSHFDAQYKHLISFRRDIFTTNASILPKLSPSRLPFTPTTPSSSKAKKSPLAALLSSSRLKNGSCSFVFPASTTGSTSSRGPQQGGITEYRRIEDHGLIGNCCTAALVGIDACIDWFCYPSFDSPSIFASILDSQLGGFYSIRASIQPVSFPSAINGSPASSRPLAFDPHGVIHSQEYVENTNILVSTFTSDQSQAQVHDFFPLPLHPSQLDPQKGMGKGWLVRQITATRGPTMWFELECCPAFNYGMDGHEVQILPNGARFISPQLTMVLTCSQPRPFQQSQKMSGGVAVYFQLEEGEKEVFVFREMVQLGAEFSSVECDIDVVATEKGTQQDVHDQLPHLTSHHNYESSVGNSPVRTSPLTSASASTPSARSVPSIPPMPLPPAEVVASGKIERERRPSMSAVPPSPSARSNSLDLSPLLWTCRHLGSELATPRAIPAIDLSSTAAARYSYRHHETPDFPQVSLKVCQRLYAQTAKYWRDWSNKCTYRGQWRPQMLRSILALKLMTFAPTGAIVAAPTCSLPESIGGIRNWDYRFTWLRDSSLILKAFMLLGYQDEAIEFMKWLEDRCTVRNVDPARIGSGLQIMYGLRGETRLDELVLEHFQGYQGSKPVRIGNAAVEQLQMDIYGEMLDMVNDFDQKVQPVSPTMWVQIEKLVEFVCQHYHSKDASIWEVRGGPQDFTFSKLMCWVALDRAVQMAERRARSAELLPRWRHFRDEIHSEIQERAWNESKRSFVQAYGSHSLDAACLFMPLVGFLPPNHPRMTGTIDAILSSVSMGGLMSDNKVFRYDVESTDDGLHCDSEGTFSMCTLWAVEALARAGVHDREYLQRSVEIFKGMLKHGNHLGLFSEEIGLKGESLGNFPQGFSHLALVQAGVFLDRALNSNQD